MPFMKPQADPNTGVSPINGVAPPRTRTSASLKIEIKNFGPISKGKITLKPLTIFMGHNNSGKSYAAVLIHSILSAVNRTFPAPGSPGGTGAGPASAVYEKFQHDITNAMSNKGSTGSIIPPRLAARMRRHICNDLFGRAVEESITGCFGSRARALVQRGHRSAGVKVGTGDGFSVSISNRIVTRFGAGVDLARDPDPRATSKLLAALKEMGSKNKERPVPVGMLVARAISDSVAARARVAGTPASSFYLPAAPLAGTDEPGAQGFQSGLVSGMIPPRGRDAGFGGLASKMEAELLDGRLDLGRGTGGRHEAHYQSGGMRIPLYAASSTVSGVAPLSLYLRRLAVPGLLVMEEPEAHLHPSSQVVLAKYIVRMVRAGFYVLVSTHSPVMVDVFGTYMRSSAVNPGFRRRIGLDPGDYLGVDEVAPYKFTGAAGGGYEIKRIRTDMEDGIPQDEYIRVIEGIYRGMARLERRLREQRG